MKNIAKFFRGHTQSWKVESMKECNYKCILTGSKDFAIHHLIGFNIILDKVFSILETKMDLTSTQTSDYTKEELDYMLKIFNEVHSQFPLGVCVRKDIHDLFHKLYGSGGNNKEQWDRFVLKYKNGDYNNIIK